MATAELFSAGSNPEKRRAEAWLKDRLARGKIEAFTETVDITPAIAEMLLARNPENRSRSQTAINTYASDIAGGRWQLNGEAIKVSKDGLLNDGQHRCAAIVQAARPIKTMIVFGCERDSRLTLDQGKARTPGDYLAMEGVEYANLVAAVASFIWQYETHGELKYHQRDKPTKQQIRETMHSHPGILDSVKKVPSNGVNLVGGKSLITFCHYLIAQAHGAEADTFIGRLVRGDGLEIDDPVFTARNSLMKNRGGRGVKANDKARTILKAWSLFRDSRKAKVIRTGDAELGDFI